jgi:hypothetical protein
MLEEQKQIKVTVTEEFYMQCMGCGGLSSSTLEFFCPRMNSCSYGTALWLVFLVL